MSIITDQMKSKIKFWVIPEGMSEVYYEPNLIREIFLEPLFDDEDAIIFKNSSDLVQKQVSFNTKQQISVLIENTQLLVLTERKIELSARKIYMSVEPDRTKFYQLYKQENQVLHELKQELITPDHNAYIFAEVLKLESTSNFRQQIHLLPESGNTDFKIKSLQTNIAPINRIYGISEHQRKQEIFFKKTNTDDITIPMILSPIAMGHDVKMWDILSDPYKCIELPKIKSLIKLEKTGKNNFSYINALLVPPVAKDALRRIIQTSVASSSAFEGIDPNGKISGIRVDRLTKMSADIVVDFLIQNIFLKIDPNIRDTAEWIAFSQLLYSMSHAISMPSWMLPSGKTEQSKVLLPFHINIKIDPSAVYDTNGDYTEDKIIFEVKSLYYDIDTTDIDDIKFTLKPNLKKFLNGMYAFRTPDPYAFPELDSPINAKNDNMNINVRIFDESSSVKKYLFWLPGNQKSLEKLITKTTYQDVEVIEKTLRYDFDTLHYNSNLWIKDLPNAKDRNPNWITITNKQDPRYITILSKLTGIPVGYQDVSMKIAQSYHPERTGNGRGHGGRAVWSISVLLTINNTPSLPDVDTILQNPVLDSDRFIDKLQQVTGKSDLVFDILPTDELTYIFIKGWLLSNYTINVSYKDKNNKEQTKEIIGWWPQRYDNSITEFKLAINQKINI